LRLREWDYRLPGPYFVTLCTQGRLGLFGQVSDSEMARNPAGNMIQTVWDRIPTRYPNALLDDLVVMPNHIHGIITLETDDQGEFVEDAPVLSDVVRWFKIQTTMKYGDGVKASGWPRYQEKLWQPGFMNHIIRTDAALNRLRYYIASNPALWEDDTFHPDAKQPVT
jgi:REP element-mobilizing transposase RayT